MTEPSPITMKDINTSPEVENSNATSVAPSDFPKHYQVIKHVKPDETDVPYDDHVGIGMECIVYRHGKDKVLKIPRGYRTRAPDGTWSDPPTVSIYSAEHIARGQEAYERLKGVVGIAEYFGIESGEICLKYYTKGSLEKCLESADEKTRYKWMIEATEIVRKCHEARILLFDIHMQNFVVDDDLTLRGIDSAQVEFFALDTDMVNADCDGLTVKVDLVSLGCVLYSLATGTRFRVDCWSEEEWPTEFRSTEHLIVGQVIQRCWDRQYSSAEELLEELRALG